MRIASTARGPVLLDPALSPLQAGGIVTVTVVTTLAICYISESLGARQFYMYSLAATVFAAWFAGLLPGIIAGTICALSVNYLFIEPFHSIIATSSDLLNITIFIIVAFLISGLEQSRLQAKRALTETRIQLEAILANVADGITAQRVDGSFAFVNDAAASLTQYGDPEKIYKMTRQEIRSNVEITDDNGKPLSFDVLPNQLALKKGISSELAFHQKFIPTGDERWIQLKSQPIFDPQGKVLMAINVFTDVTVIKKAQRELAAANKVVAQQAQRLQALIDNIPALVWEAEVDSAGMPHFTYMSDSALQILGYSKESFADPTFGTQLIMPEDQETLPALLQEVYKTRADSFVSRVVAADRRVLYLETQLTFTKSSEGSERIYGVSMDITDRHMAELKIAEANRIATREAERRQNFIHNLPAIAWEAVGSPETEQTQTFVSDYVETMLGYTKEEWLHPDFWGRIVVPDDVERVTATIIENFQKRSGKANWRVYRKDGQIVHLESYITVVSQAEGENAVYGVTLDVTERRTQEETLAQYMSDLRRSNEELQQFAYVASHDLQEPLRMVTSYLQLIEQRYKEKLDSDAHEFIDFAVDGANRMKALIQDLLAFSRVETDGRAFLLIKSADALGEALRNLQITLEESGAQIIYDPATLPVLKADQHQLAQVFQNLIGNAIKFQRKGETPCVTLSAVRTGVYWQFAVQDNGIGIESQYLERIFIIFQRLHNRAQYVGTGIGLAICRRVIERHGGKIWAESKPGAGTTILFTLPINQGREGQKNRGSN